LQRAYKFREHNRKKRSRPRTFVGLLRVGFGRSYQHNGNLKTTLIRGNTVVPQAAKTPLAGAQQAFLEGSGRCIDRQTVKRLLRIEPSRI
jgi:hypothetical protein